MPDLNQPPAAALDLDSLRARVHDAVQARLSAAQPNAHAIGPATEALLAQVALLTSGGKRLRAALAYWAFRACGGSSDSAAIWQLCAALELYQASALFHDDLIDQSDTRRGQPTAHQSFAEQHRAGHWRGDAAQYGISSAVLLGDYSLALATDSLLEAAELAKASRETTLALLRDFNAMARTVALGQYLDLLAENETGLDSQARITRAQQVIDAKSASYSAVYPLRLGALLAGADPALVDGLGAVGLPLGQAFQLRDDLLGVFGDPALTGKPAGDDLVSGKRTVLIELALRDLDDLHARVLESLLRRGELTPAQLDQARLSIARSGAVRAVDTMVADLTADALNQLDALDLQAGPKAQLKEIARQMTDRDS